MLLGTLMLGTIGLSGCSAQNTKLVSPEQAIVEVGERNKDVLKALKTMGAVSDVKANHYMDVINANVEKYKAALQSTDDIQKVNEIVNSIVNIIGIEHDKGYYGLHEKKDACGNQAKNVLMGDLKFEPTTTNMWKGDNFAGIDARDAINKVTTEAEGKTVVPLEFLDANLVDGLCKDINKQIWVLDPNKVKTREQLLDLVDRLHKIKEEYTTGDIPYEKFKTLYDLYFMKTDATLFDYTSDKLLKVTTDNHTALGKESGGNSVLNKDIVINGTLTGTLHTKKKVEGTDDYVCADEHNITRNVGVYTLRIKEFDAALQNELSKGAFTNNKYIAVEGETSDEVSTAILMEYPVAVIKSLVPDSAGSNKWHFEWEETDMRVNIFNGEILFKDASTGEYKVINNEDNEIDRIYRVAGANAGKVSNLGKNISFLPNGSTTLGLESLITLADKQVKLTSRVEKSSDYNKDNIGLDFNKWYPKQYIKRLEGRYTIDEHTDTTYYFQIDGESENKVEAHLEELEYTNSYLKKFTNYVYASDATWEKLWKLYEDTASQINTKEGTSYSTSREDWELYKLYKALNDAGNNLENDKISNWFTGVDVFNYLNNVFNPNDDTYYLMSNYFTDYDREWLYASRSIDSFEYPTSGSGMDTFDWYQDSSVMHYNGRLSEVEKAIDNLADDSVKAYYNIVKSDGKLFNITTLNKFTLSSEEDRNIGTTVDVVTENLKFNSDTNMYTYKYAGVWYNCSDPFDKPSENTTPEASANKDIRDVTTVRFALTDYLELTYMPNVVDSEDFIATGRRISITDIKGEGDQVIGFFANKLGDKIEKGNSEVRASDIIDYTSGQKPYYDRVAKLLDSVYTNSVAVEEELKKSDGERVEYLKTIIDPASNVEDTGMVSDKLLLNYKVGINSINPILQFTSTSSGDRPSLDAIDYNNNAKDKNVYYGLCVNTHAFNSGLYTTWIDINGDGGDNGSLMWWNAWLANHGYEYQIDISKLKSVMTGVYSVSLAEIDNTIVFNQETLKVINKEMNEKSVVQTHSLINTISKLLGSFLLVYGLILMGLWVIDVNMVNGPGLLGVATFGKFVAVSDSSEIPLMPGDGKIYVDFKALFMATMIFMVVGMMLLLFDIQVFWDMIPRMFRTIIDAFRDLLLNK